MRKVLQVHIMLAVLPCLVHAQSERSAPGIETAISRMMNQAREKKEIKGLSEAELKGADPHQVLLFLAPYDKDESPSVRRLALLYAVRLTGAHPIPTVRQEVTYRLVQATISHSVSQSLEWLMDFTAEDFHGQSKSLIREALSQANEDIVGGDRSVWLCGMANMQDQLPRLEELLIDEVQYQAKANKTGDKKWYLTTGWAARLARARMGSKEDIRRCIELAEAETDATERVLRILPNIGYIRQPEAIEYLQKYLKSGDRLPPLNPGMLGELYAGRAMHILAQSLQGYPVKQKPARNYTEEEIGICRKWMSDRANWRIIR